MAKKTDTNEEKEPLARPEMYSPEWKDYIMSQFRPKELVDGYPTCDGLRRVVEQEIGQILEFGPRAVVPALDKFGLPMCTVTYYVTILREFNGLPQECSYGEVADAWDASMTGDYKIYPAACAATRAEGRIYRKLLNIKASAEEVERDSDVEDILTRTRKSSEPKASSERKRIMQKRAKGCGIDIEKMVKYYYTNGDVEYDECVDNGDFLDKDTEFLLEKLSNFQNSQMTEEEKSILKERCVLDVESK